MKIRPAFKMHGGKRYLKNWLVSHFPENYQQMTYLEPYCGAANVLLAKDRSKEEHINDIDLGIVAILRTIRDYADEFSSRLKTVEYNRENFNLALSNKVFIDDIDHAVNELILRRMSRGGLKKAFSWSNRQRGGQPGDVNAWKTIISEIPKIAGRLQGVRIFQWSALEVIQAFNDPNVIVYADPTYVPSTRVSRKAYEFEMTVDDHVELAKVLNKFRGKVVLSGYPSVLYKELYDGWRCEEKKIANHASQKKIKEVKTEMLWLNF